MKIIKNNRGFSLVEAILAASIFSLLITALIGSFIYGQTSTFMAGSRARALFLAEEGLEAVKNIKDSDFSSLVDGAYGLAIAGNQWSFSGNSDITDIFTRQIIINSLDTEKKQIISEVTWDQNLQRTGTIQLATYLTNWQASVGVSGCEQYCQNAGYLNGFCRQNIQQCIKNLEVNELDGDQYCTGGPSADTCCCAP